MGTFFERLGAYILDIVIVSLILLIIGMGLPSNNVDDINEQIIKVEEKYMNNEITASEYFNESYSLLYELQKVTKLSSFVGLIITIAYFVIFQAMYNGQTLGKKLLKLQVVDNETHDNIGVMRMFVRSLFTLSIFSSGISLLMLLFLSKNAYIIGYLLISGLEGLFIIVAMIMILYRKDKRGLHDLIVKSCVIKEGGGC